MDHIVAVGLVCAVGPDVLADTRSDLADIITILDGRGVRTDNLSALLATLDALQERGSVYLMIEGMRPSRTLSPGPERRN